MDERLAAEISAKLELLLGQPIGVIGSDGQTLVTSPAITGALIRPEQAARPLPIVRGDAIIGYIILQQELVAPAAMRPLVLALIESLAAEPKQLEIVAKTIADPSIELTSLMENQALWQSVEAFLANNLNLTETAEQLGVHRNTLIYRLDKARQITGLDVRRFDDALELKISLRQKTLS